jgi:hypothetical protein
MKRIKNDEIQRELETYSGEDKMKEQSAYSEWCENTVTSIPLYTERKKRYWPLKEDMGS